MKQKVRYFDDYLNEQHKDREFRRHFRQARLAVEVADQIVKLREKLRISQAVLAKRMGTKQQTISRLESGDYEGFTLTTLMKIAEATRTHLVVRFSPPRRSRAV